jgi:hypothetical protein
MAGLEAAGFSLFATICIDGTLHGLPKTLCNEFQIRGYSSVTACETARKRDVKDWLVGIAFLAPHLVTERCGPAEANGDDT